MTDVLDDLFSSQEVAPKAAAIPSILPHRLACDICGADRGKTGLPFLSARQVAGHKKQHASEEAKEKTAAAPKPAAKTPTTSGPAKSVRRTRTPAAPAGRRKPLGENIAKLILQIGRQVNNLVDPPTGVAIMFEAGALGAAIDGALAGGWVDGKLQKAAQVSEKWEPLVPLVSLPAMIFLLSRNPQLQPQLEGEIREALESVLAQSLPLLRERAKRTQETLAAIEELRGGNFFGVEIPKDSEDPVGDILAGFFSPPVDPEGVGDAGED
jgi:hypothetical protein